MSEGIKDTVRRINKKWKMAKPSSFWGDRLDVRYYSCWIFRSIKNKKVLDVGCGTGIILSELDDSNRKFGMDISEDHINTARAMDGEILLVRGDMLYMPFKNDSFDVILLNAMIPLIEKKKDFISALHGLLKDEGTMFIVTHNRHHHMYRKNDTMLDHEGMADLLRGRFDFRITGFNPLPSFPFFFPNAISGRIPFIWDLIAFLARHNIFSAWCRGMLVEAVKRKG